MNLTAKLREQAAPIIKSLTTLKFQPEVIGGVLRVEALGGSTKDIDIAIRVTPEDYAWARKVLLVAGYEVQHACNTEYAKGLGFFADFRKGDVNVIVYNRNLYPTHASLIESFDLNINKYYEEAGRLRNDCFDGTVVLYSAHHLHLPRPERIERFRSEYPHLNWEAVP